MADQHERDQERQITSDRDTVKVWATESNALPVRHGGAEGEYGLVTEDQYGEDHDRMEWQEFFDAIERDGKAVVALGSSQDRSFEVVDREEAVDRTSLSTEEFEESLMEGETVTSEVTETRVVEQTVVEHADMESELIDSQPVEETIVDAELISREIHDCSVGGISEMDEGDRPDFGMFEVGHRSSSDLGIDVEVEVTEYWSVVSEAVEQATIETRVVDTDVTGSETSEADAVEVEMELEDVEQTIVESELLASEDVDTDVIDEKSIESEFTEGDAVITEVVERQTVEEEVTVDRTLSGTISDAETKDVEWAGREVVESEMAEADEYEIGEVDTSRRGDAETSPGSAERGEPSSTDTEMTESGGEMRVTPHEDDRGKKAIDTSGEEIGIVDDVEGGTLYVNPHPSLTEKIMAKLGWGDGDEDSYPVEEDHIEEITDDHVRLTVER